MRRILFLSLFILSFVVVASAAEWVGFWGGGNADLEAQFPGISEIERGRWTNLPLCWSFGGNLRAWTEEEQAVARAAIAYWNEIEVLPNGRENELRGQIFEERTPECRGGDPPDIRLIWSNSDGLFRDFGDPNGDEKSTNFEGQESIHIAERMAPVLPAEPCQDLLTAGEITRCNLIVLNVEFFESFFIDPTPTVNEEFEEFTLTHCDGEAVLLQPVSNGPADGKRDLFTLIVRRFGFAIGIQDDVGCDGSIFTFDAEDDRGSVMWPDAPNGRRVP